MAKRDLIAIGASAGGLEALQQLLKALPADLDAAVLIVLHTSNHAGSLLPQIMQRATRLLALHPQDGQRIQKGHVYIAPPDNHMIVDGDILRVIHGPRENLHRPAIDPLFRSAAASYGRRAIGVVLTGMLDDGTSGLMVIRARGGEAVVQDPATAMFSSMPKCALEQVPDACVLPLAKIPALLTRLVSEDLPRATPEAAGAEEEAVRETRFAEFNMSVIENEKPAGKPSPFGCPECGGVLWETNDKGFLRFRCRVGHAYTARHLGAEQRHAIETALWSALRALEENASLYNRMAQRATQSSHRQASETYEDRANNIQANARTLRNFLLQVNAAEEKHLEAEQA